MMLLRDKIRVAERRRVLLSGVDLGMELVLGPNLPVLLRRILPVYHRQTSPGLSHTPVCMIALRRPLSCCGDPWDNEVDVV
jgi:hypothetical protein